MTPNQVGDAIMERSRALVVAIVAGISLVVFNMMLDTKAAWSGVLVAALWGISIAVGAGIFMAVNGVGGGTWWVGLHRHVSALTQTLLVPLIALAAVLAVGFHAVYPGASHHGGGHGPAFSHAKEMWLSAPFFIGRAVIIALIWVGVLAMMRRSVARFAAAPSRTTYGPYVRGSAVFLLLLGPTISLAFFDWGMAVEPEWYSTIYGFYGFAASFQGAIAAIAAFALLSNAPAAQDPERRHNLGKLLFGFSTFWAYIWLSQYMLIWYANLPEETMHFLRRFSGDWAILFWLNVVVNFAVPFIVLLSAKAKRHTATLLQVSLVVLAGRWLDFYLLIAPPKGPFSFPYGALGAALAVLAGMILVCGRAMQAKAVQSSVKSAADPAAQRMATPEQA